MNIQITRKNITDFSFLVIICVVWFLIGWILRGQWDARQMVQPGAEIVLIEQVRQRLLAEYFDGPLGTRELTYAAIRGMLRHTRDPYAALLEPAVAQRFGDDFAGQSGTVGLHLEADDGELRVGSVTPGGPADQAGLRAGDIILAVDGMPFDDATTGTEASLMIRGPVGQPAHIVVRRDAQELEFSPIRQERNLVSSEMLAGDIAYVSLSAFTTNAPQEMKTTLQALSARQPRGLIWDLRSNGGGSMEATQEVLSYFVEDGLLFTVELKGGVQKPFTATGEAIITHIPIVVLIDEHTYSAGETAAATISERGRGILIGRHTYGKSTVNATIPLIESCMLQMTIGKSLSPTGKWYQGRGVPPDIFVTDNPATGEDETLQFAVNYMRQHLSRE
jgi:carboxyl-terminal processing protease